MPDPQLYANPSPGGPPAVWQVCDACAAKPLRARALESPDMTTNAPSDAPAIDFPEVASTSECPITLPAVVSTELTSEGRRIRPPHHHRCQRHRVGATSSPASPSASSPPESPTTASPQATPLLRRLPTKGEDGQNSHRHHRQTPHREHWTDHTSTRASAPTTSATSARRRVRLAGPNGKRFLLPKTPTSTTTSSSPPAPVSPLPRHGHRPPRRRRHLHIHLFMGPLRLRPPLPPPLARPRPEAPKLPLHPPPSRATPGRRARPHVRPQPHRHGTGPHPPALAADNTLIYICGVAGMELGVFRNSPSTSAPPNSPTTSSSTPKPSATSQLEPA